MKKNKKKEKELKQELETEKINLLCLKRDLGKVRKRWKKILTLKRHERIKILWTKTKCVDFFHYYYEQLRLVKLKSCSLYQQCRWLKKFNSLKRLTEKKDDEIKYCIQQQKKQKHNKRDCEQQLIVLKDKDLLYPNVQNDYISNLTAMEKKPRMKFAKSVFEEVLKNESFMKKTLKQTSNFYLSFIPLMNNSEYEEFVQKIIEFLIREENISFVREIRNASKLCFFWGSQITKEEYPILYVLSNDCGVYILNSLWRPIGETTIEYIQKEIENDAMHLLYKVPDNKDSLFSTSVIFVAINFFNIMTSCVILQKRVDNVWILYYYHFVKELLNGLDEKDLNKNADSQVIFFIQEMCRYLNELLALAKKMGVKEHVFFINHCKSQILELIKDCLKIDESCRKELIEELT